MAARCNLAFANIMYVCAECGKDFRGYTPIGSPKGGVIYSDMAPEAQCERRQMNLEGLW